MDAKFRSDEAVRILPLTAEEIPAIVEIERTWNLEPWSHEAYLEELAKPYSHTFVARIERPGATEEIAGYICFWLIADEIQILNIAIQPEYRRRGIGRILLLKALELGCARQVEQAVLEVRESNTAARRLYESLGFEQCGVRPGYYGVVKESAILMRLDMHRFREKCSNLIESHRCQDGRELHRKG